MWWPMFLKTTRQAGVPIGRQPRRTSVSRKRAPLRPTLEQLESRDTPSVSFHVGATVPVQAWNDSVVAVADLRLLKTEFISADD